MGLNKFDLCNSSHQSDLEYCCLRTNKAFCKNCWKNSKHNVSCNSNRCGNYVKLAHLVLNRASQLKNNLYIKSLSSSEQMFNENRQYFLLHNLKLVENLKEWVQYKVPLFIWAMMHTVFQSSLKFKKPKTDNDLSTSFDKYDKMSCEMFEIINPKSQKQVNQKLEETIASYYIVNHQLQQLPKLINQKPKWIQTSEDKLKQIRKHFDHQISSIVTSIRTNFTKILEEEIAKIVSSFSRDQKFNGVCFSKKAEMFHYKQYFPNQTIFTKLLTKVQNYQSDIYHGYHLSFSQLKKFPDQLLQVGKTFMKQRLYQAHQSIKYPNKSKFPYKFAYIMATTSQNNIQYQKIILQLQKINLKIIIKQTNDPFKNSCYYAIIGQQLILFRLYSHPKVGYQLTIYGYKEIRKQYYDCVINILNLSDSSFEKRQRFIKYQTELSPVKLVFCNLKICHEHLFQKIQKNQFIFEGEQKTAAQGEQLMQKLICKWKETAAIDIDFGINVNTLFSLIV